MGRTKGATNKKTQSNSTEVVEKKVSNRGRKPGQVIEKEPAIIISLNSQYRIKIDKLNKTLQQKGKSELEDDNEDAGWKSLGHYSKFEHIFSKLVDTLSKEKARKVEIMQFEQFKEFFEKSTKEARKMFGKIDMVEM